MLSKLGWAERVRLACIGLSASALATIVIPIKFATPAEAKTPGSTYCYHKTCHRVKTIAETQALVGVEEAIVASHYDDCSRDRYNPCGLTSSGERFHPDRPDNTASPIYPDGTVLLVWSPETQQALVVRVNNAGPYWGDRKLDLSRAAAEKLGFEGKGVAKVRVRVVKAPEPAEAKYVENRNYAPVLGDIGHYESVAAAETGMVVALALQTSSPMQLASAVGYPDRASVVETPQALGRNVTLAAFSIPGARQSVIRPRKLAVLYAGRGAKQSIWGEDSLDDLNAADDNRGGGVSASKTPEPAKVAEVAEQKQEATPPKHVARRKTQTAQADSSTQERSHKSRARSERRSQGNKESTKRTAKVRRYSEPAVVAYRERPVREVSHERSAEQIMSAGIRAQSSSTM